MKIKRMKSEAGFTIIELMIALSVLSVILVMGSVVTIQISRTFTKGMNQSNLQNATRGVLQDMTSAIQFSGTDPDGCGTNGCTDGSTKAAAICMGNVRYSFLLNHELGVDGGANKWDPTNATGINTPHVLWRDKMNTTGTCKPAIIEQGNPSSGGTIAGTDGYEMMPEHTRLTKVSVQEIGVGSGVYTVTVWGVYGDSDLMTFPPADNPAGKPACKGSSGSQFCAISLLTTSAAKRLEN